jgi:hypothetical protein
VLGEFLNQWKPMDVDVTVFVSMPFFRGDTCGIEERVWIDEIVVATKTN